MSSQDNGECWMCGGSGEIEADIPNRLTGVVSQQPVGCPLCIERDFQHEIAGLKEANAALVRVLTDARGMILNLSQIASSNISMGGVIAVNTTIAKIDALAAR